MVEGAIMACTRRPRFLLYQLLIVMCVYIAVCSTSSCPRVHIYNCARFERIRKKSNTCKYTFVVPEFADGSCPEEGELSLAYLEVAKLNEKYDDMERKMDDLLSEIKERDGQQTSSAQTEVPLLMQQDGGNVLEGRGSSIDVREDTAPQVSNVETAESFTVTITAHLATNTDLKPEIVTNQRLRRRSRKTRSVCDHDIKLENVKVSRIVDYSDALGSRSTVSKTSDFVGSKSETYATAEVDRLNEENKSLKSVVDRLEARLQKLESAFEDMCNT